ncbi:microtubule integrity protein mal3 [Coemansia sp. Benny D115]|nr:microtubule integrity protein mal3 [Coemansia sp. Benny D115]
MTSRQELIAWVNSLLQTGYTKVEQLGSGAAYCQIFDSIYGDVKLERVKFSANQEYEYVENFKILQNVMTKHKVDKPIDPTRLTKCRFQDNFEFLQWLKRYWDAYAPQTHYDAVGRRNGKPAGPVDAHRPMSSASSARSSSAGAYRARPVAGARVAGRPGVARGGLPPRASPGSRAAGNAAGGSQQVQELSRNLAEAKVLIETAEKERDFYFGKLREIEVYLQSLNFGAGTGAESMGKDIQAILYSTEDADADPEDAQGAAMMDDMHDSAYDQPSANHMGGILVDEEETF